MTRIVALAGSLLALAIVAAPAAHATDAMEKPMHKESMHMKKPMMHKDSMMHKDKMMKGDAMKGDAMQK